jgi:diaminopimelate decarboxylase
MATLRDSSSGELLLGGVRLVEVVERAGTPAYVYDLDAMAAEARAIDGAFEQSPHLVCYAVKANSAGAVVRAIATQGCGADVVSGAELLLAQECGIPAGRIVYSGVAKTDDEIDRAIAAGIGALQLESIEEAARVEARARAARVRARVSVRLNPGVDLDGATHAHIATGHDRAKFGVPRSQVAEAVQRVEGSEHLHLVGMTTHVGSHFKSTAPYLDSARVLFGIVRGLRESGKARAIEYVNTGGGFGVAYDDGVVPPPADFVKATRRELGAHGLADLALYAEPGRALVAAHGVLLARVVQTKVSAAGRWLMIDAGMNDLIRPALYQARHRIVPIDRVDPALGGQADWRVVGPVCESSDDFGEHSLPRDAPRGVAILDAGAYGYTMASLYNGRQLPAEVFLSGGSIVGLTPRLPVEGWVRERSRAGAL